MEEKGFFASLFDLSFTEFVTTRLVPVLFVLSIVVAAIYTLFLVFAGFKGGVITGIGALVLSPLLFILMVIGARVYSELVIVVFRIAENTRTLAEQKQSNNQ